MLQWAYMLNCGDLPLLLRNGRGAKYCDQHVCVCTHISETTRSNFTDFCVYVFLMDVTAL